MLDVTPLSLGLETLGNVMTKLIDRNTTIPVKKSQVFSTAVDNQPAVDIHVLQGERQMVEDNISLGRFRLDGIPNSSRGVPQIEVTFDIDANGILNVSAKDKTSGKEQSVTISASTNINKTEIDRLIQEAKQHESEDIQKREITEARNMADSLIYQAEKLVKESDQVLAETDSSRLTKLVVELQETLKLNDLSKIRQGIHELENTINSIKQNQAKKNEVQLENESTDRSEDDVVEGEFHEA